MPTNFRFGEYLLRSDTRQLLLRSAAVHLTPKAFELLHTLVANAPRAVSKVELQNRLWPKTFVSAGNLALLITELRNALHDDAHAPQFIRTVHGFGYAIQGEVVPEPMPGTTPATCGLSFWLIWRAQALLLSTGSNVVGRQPGVDVLIDVPGISRVHARITIENSDAFIEDLDSKNGTYVEGRPVTTRTTLSDGDHVQLGPALLLFRCSSAEGEETLTFGAGQSAS
jgi:DNA-binding winged helix-turn-helix (wHTH) protein